MGTLTLRADIATGLYGLITGFMAANPSYLNAGFRNRPAAMGDRPLAYVGPRNEAIDHSGQTLYQRTPTPSIAFVWASGADRGEVADVQDAVIDAFIVYCEARPHAVSNDTTINPTGVEDVELDLDGAFYPASIVSFTVFAMGGTA